MTDPASPPRGLPRRIASAVVPDSGKRLVDRARNRYGMSVIAPANREFVARHGLMVSGGPFAGMEYLPGMESTQGDVVTKLLGSYESELHGAVAAWRAAPPQLIVNVGCAEGYYAVGLAHAIGSTRVLAHDIDPEARALCARLAQLNGISDRVEVHGECTPQTLTELPADGVALVCDCEGYELTLLDPERVPNLRGWPIIVECHDFVDPSITPTIQRRFAPTHDVVLIRSEAPDDAAPELAFMTARQRAAVLGERPVAMNWAALTPRR